MVGGIRPVTLALLVLALIPASATASATTQIIVKREAGLSASERRDIRADADVRLVESLPLPRTEVVAAPQGEVRDALRDLNADPNVVYAEPDFVRHAATPPNDAYFPFLWGLNNEGQETPGFDDDMIAGTPDADMDVLQAWDHSTGAGQLVAMVDSGVDTGRGDLAANLAPGYDWIDEDTDPMDTTGHGTGVAGTIVALRNDTDIVGVAYAARVLPLRVLGSSNSGRVSDIVGAFDFAGDAGVRIVNASFAADEYSQAERDVIAAHPNTLFVVAAGNAEEGEDTTAPQYPCSYPEPNIVCVGASDADDKVADFSRVGATSVDLFAPGDRIFSIDLGGGYKVARGTSMAAPHVAGEAALLLEKNPAATVAALKGALLTTVDTRDDGEFDESVSRGRANADTAVHSDSVAADRDGDGVLDDVDNCIAVSNPDQDADACADGVEPDSDDDGIVDEDDACPYYPGVLVAQGCPGIAGDRDSDSILDIFDNCVSVANANQRDLDRDGFGDACDPDIDGDRIANVHDNCDTVANASQSDLDRDGVGDACDPTPLGHDNDRDGKLSAYDACPNQYGTLANGCPAPPPDTDGDGLADSRDACATVFARTANGCPPPAAQVASVSAKAKRRGTRRSARIVVKTTDVAVVRVTVQRKKGAKWVRVTRKTRWTVSNRVALTVKGLKRGRHRVRVTINSANGRGKSVTHRFFVR